MSIQPSALRVGTTCSTIALPRSDADDGYSIHTARTTLSLTSSRTYTMVPLSSQVATKLFSPKLLYLTSSSAQYASSALLGVSAFTLFAPQTRIVTSSSAPVNTLPYYRRTRLPARQNLHPPEESSHWQTPNVQTPSQWNNLPVNQSSSGIKLPVTGGNGTQIDLSASEKLQ